MPEPSSDPSADGCARSNPALHLKPPPRGAQTQGFAVVLGAKVLPSGAPSAALLRRVSYAVQLYQRGEVSGLILSGGGTPISEAEAMARICRAAGLPNRAILLEPKAQSTAQNLSYAKQLLPDGCEKVILVTDAWHMRRACLAARRLGLKAAGAPPPGPKPKLRVRLREYVATAVYWLMLRR